MILQIAAAEGKQRETVRDWVAKARELGYLTSHGQGRAGADPGPKLIEFMNDASKNKKRSGT